MWRSSASPSRPGGSCRTQTVCKRHRRQHPPARRRARTCSASHRALAMSRRSRACSPSTPCSRIRHQSFSARNRRPSGMPQSRRFFTCAVDRRLQVARVGRHHAHEVLGIAHVVERAVERRAEPLVRVEDERVRPLDALPHPAALGQDHRASPPSPRRRAARARVAARPRRSPRPGRARSVAVVPDGRDDGAGQRRPLARSRGDQLVERVGAHRVVGVAGRARTFSRPKPARSAAFSTELCACADA